MKKVALLTIVILISIWSDAQIGLWSSEAELRKNTVTGPAWEAVKTAADIDFSKPVINNNNSNDDVNCLAAAIVFARTGDHSYKDRVITALEYNVPKGNPGFDSNGILTWCRNVGAYALAADLVGYRTSGLEDWFRNMVEVYRDPGNHNNTIEEIFCRRANNWGTQAFGTLCAVYGFLRDTSKLKEVRNYWIRLVTGPNPGARILERFDASLSIWEIGDNAILRAVRVLEVDWSGAYNNGDTNWSANGDDTWMLPFIDFTYGTDFSNSTADFLNLWKHGKNAGWPYVLPQQNKN